MQEFDYRQYVGTCKVVLIHNVSCLGFTAQHQVHSRGLKTLPLWSLGGAWVQSCLCLSLRTSNLRVGYLEGFGMDKEKGLIIGFGVWVRGTYEVG